LTGAVSIHHKRRAWVRSVDEPELLERFLVSAATTLVGIRIYLALTGYPQIGGHGLHIAHLLWGGLLMLVSLVLLLGFVGRDLRLVVAIVAGAGWGAFFDELGKFITSDVNYFYRPAMSLIYASFVALFVAFRFITGKAASTPRSALVQCLELVQTGALRGLRPTERERATALLAGADADDPLVPALRTALARTAVLPEPRHPVANHVREWLVREDDRVWWSRWFVPLVVVVAVAIGGLAVADVVSEITNDPNYRLGSPAISWSDGLKSAAAGVGGFLVLLGALVLARDRLRGWKLMRAGLLVFLLLVQPLSFYTEQVIALVGLAVYLLLYGTVGTAIALDETKIGKRVAVR
jgi:hypothetical protein